MDSQNRSARLERVWANLFFLGLLANIGFVLSLPLFPTGDGPLHLYLSSVFWQIVTHPHGGYAQFYAVRHLVQPYSLHYYALIALEHWVSPNLAEKLFVVVILLVMATGFRSLCTAFAPRPGAVALWVLPLLLNWTLGAGLLNFTLAAGLMLWGMRFYYRCAERPRAALGAFAGILLLLVLSHPVPLLMLIAMIAGDLLLRALTRQGRRGLRRAVAQFGALALALAGFAIPLLLADRSQVERSVSDLRLHLLWLRYILSGVRLGLVYLPNPAGWLYLGLLVAMLPVTALFALRSGWLRRLRHGAAPADRLLLLSLVALLLSLWLPEHMNGSALFADRMWLLLWLLAAPTAAAMVTTQRTEIAVAASGMATATLALVLAWLCLRPVALEQQQLALAPLPDHAQGIFLEAGDPAAGLGSASLRTTTYPVNYWAGTRDFFPHDDVLLNTPWMNLTIMPLHTRTGQPLPGRATPGALIEDPMKFAAALMQHQPAAELAVSRAGFVFYNDPYRPPGSALREVEQMLAPQLSAWKCTGQTHSAVCEHEAAR